MIVPASNVSISGKGAMRALEDRSRGRRHHRTRGGLHRQRRQFAPDGRCRRGRGHSSRRRAETPRRVPPDRRVPDRGRADDWRIRLGRAARVARSRSGLERRYGGRGRTAGVVLPPQLRAGGGGRGPLHRVSRNQHRRVRIPQGAGGGDRGARDDGPGRFGSSASSRAASPKPMRRSIGGCCRRRTSARARIGTTTRGRDQPGREATQKGPSRPCGTRSGPNRDQSGER